MELVELKKIIEERECEETSTVVAFNECGRSTPATSCGFACAPGGIL